MVTIIERASEVRARNVWEMLANICLKSTNQQGENGATNQGQRGEGDMASEREKLYVASEVEIFA